MLTKKYTMPVYDVVEEAGGFRILRNERNLMTPKGKVYDLPTKSLAETIAEEWRCQVEKLNPKTMPLTQLAATALDVIPETREKVIKSLLAYTRSELLCHRAERPDALVKAQEERWQPLLDWTEEHYGLAFDVVYSVMPMSPAEELVNRLRNLMNSYDDFFLTGLQQGTDVSGSLVLGLALREGKITAEEALALSELDVVKQHEKWGADPVTEGRQKSVMFDLNAVQFWFEVLR